MIVDEWRLPIVAKVEDREGFVLTAHGGPRDPPLPFFLIGDVQVRCGRVHFDSTEVGEELVIQVTIPEDDD